jgi:hypothetical protein
MASVSLAESREDPPRDDEKSERLRLQQWRQKVRVLHVAHVLAAARCDLWYRVLGVLVAVTTTVVGTAIFTTLSESPSEEVKALASVTSVLAVVFGATQSALNLGRRVESHRRAATHYDELRHLMERWRVEHPSAVEPAPSDVADWMERWTATESQAPPILNWTFRQAMKHVTRSDASFSASADIW